jgi:hypothetical protein
VRKPCTLIFLLLASCGAPKAAPAPDAWVLAEPEGRLSFVPHRPKETWVPVEVESRGWIEVDVAVIEARAMGPGRRFRFTADAMRPVEWRTPPTQEGGRIARFEFTSGARGWAGISIRAEVRVPE